MQIRRSPADLLIVILLRHLFVLVRLLEGSLHNDRSDQIHQRNGDEQDERHEIYLRVSFLEGRAHNQI